MANILFWAVLAVIFHFLVESTIAPSYRLSLQYKIIALRDQLCTHAVVFPNEVSTEVKEMLDDSLDIVIRHLNDFSIALIFAALRTCQDKPGVAEIVEARARVVNASDSEFIQELVQQRSVIMIKAIFWNCSGWLIYVFPLLIGYGIISKFIGAVSGLRKNVVQKLVYLPHVEYQRLFNNSIRSEHVSDHY